MIVDTDMARRFLRRYLDAESGIKSSLEEIERLKSLATKTTSTWSDIGHVQLSGISSDKLSGIISKIDDIRNDIKKEISGMEKEREIVLSVIDDVPNLSQKEILRARYINGKKFEQIGDDLHYSLRHITRLHHFALRQVAQIMIDHGIYEL